MDLIEAVSWVMIALWHYLTDPIVDALDDAADRLDRRRSLRRARKGRRPTTDDTAWKRAPIPADYLMSPAEIEAYIDTEFRRHPDAPERECGAPHPARPDQWCRHPANHLWDTHETEPEEPTWT